MEMESEYLQKLQRQLEETEQEMAELFSRRCQLVSKLHADQPPLPRLTKVQALDLEGKKAAYCGVPGAYGYEATVRFFGEEFEKVSVSSFDAALTAVDHGDADYAVLPIENSSAGAVGNVYDVLAEHPVTVVGEIDVPICHCLLAGENTDLADIHEVHSHPQALQQCRHYLERHPQWVSCGSSNTALSAKMIAEEGRKDQAAIASEAAAKLYGLKILEREINDNKGNTTRFVVATAKPIYLEHSRKVRICFECHHEKGALYHLLSYFAYYSLNMTRIESRPVPRRKDGRWEYRFFVDFEGNLEEERVQKALCGLQAETTALRILGTC